MDEMFFECSNLTFIDISNFTYTNIEKLFSKLPKNGTIKVKEEYKDRVKQILQEWEIN